MLFQIISAVTGLLALVTTGGWFINYHAKKKNELALAEKSEVEANLAKLDLTEKIFEKYQQSVLSSMKGHEDKHDELRMAISEINSEIKCVAEYLNGGYSDFKMVKRDKNGKFISSKKAL
ncbi:MAG: hypothetical protein LBB53_01520 [Prevotellaceae bacterium]|jgi:hypothetical protein|nr:hypothetical protein [Prevotellaceae bacterium]